MRRAILLSFAAIFGLMYSQEASGDTNWWELTASCACMADSANDFHLAVAADSIDNIVILNDPCPSCTDVEMVVSGEGTGLIEVDINWIGGYVIKGAGLNLVFSTNDVVTHTEGYWTISGEFAADSYTDYEWLPGSPLSSMTDYGVIILVVVIAISGVYFWRRHRLCAIRCR